jgi:ABC-2 type transport system permease protein
MQQLILKDWRLHRPHILFSIAAGAAALALVQVPRELAAILGIIWFFIALIVLGSMLPVSNIINERKKQTLAFMMSLPVSPFQYATAKLVSTLGIFLVPWITLLLGGLSMIFGRHDIPNGMIPGFIVLAGMPLVGFCIITGTAIVSESEGWTVAGTIVCNSSYWLAYYVFIRAPEMKQDLASAVPVWSRHVLTFLGGEFAIVALILGVSFYLQTKKRDFI